MDLDHLAEKVVLYSFMGAFIALVYLFLGNGFSDLSLLQFTYPYQAVTIIPSWAAFVGFYLLYIGIITTDQEQIVKDVGSLLLFMAAVGFWVRSLQTTLSFPTADNETTLILYSFGLVGAGIFFFTAWRKRLS